MVIELLNKNRDLKNALKIIWILSGLISIILVFTILFFPSELMFKKIPTCEYKLLNKECFLCGTTRAFYEIKEFNFQKAYELNKLSPFLFLAILLNILILTTNLKKI